MLSTYPKNSRLASYSYTICLWQNVNYVVICVVFGAVLWLVLLAGGVIGVATLQVALGVCGG